MRPVPSNAILVDRTTRWLITLEYCNPALAGVLLKMLDRHSGSLLLLHHVMEISGGSPATWKSSITPSNISATPHAICARRRWMTAAFPRLCTGSRGVRLNALAASSKFRTAFPLVRRTGNRRIPHCSRGGQQRLSAWAGAIHHHRHPYR